MYPSRIGVAVLMCGSMIAALASPLAADEPQLSSAQQTAIANIEERADEVMKVNRSIWVLA